ncbi:MAG: RNA 2',3'-cyclic phosphodiesterase [Chloroflexi bacterium]|nr:RNA 2',3'-cyclic phosphodiesterase [Chloroflexota bacterium]
MEQPIRAFIAIDLPEDVKKALASLIDSLKRRRVEGVRWVNPDGVHLTLKFLGDIRSGQVGEVVQAMAEASYGLSSFRLELKGVGGFPNLQRPRVLWTGMGGELGPCLALWRRLDEALRPLGFPSEERPFNPHLTLGRVHDRAGPEERRRVGEALLSLPPVAGPSMLVEGISLIKSTLRPEGLLYERLHEEPLTARGG